jgi:DNA-binding SARP family transcriptional activator
LDEEPLYDGVMRGSGRASPAAAPNSEQHIEDERSLIDGDVSSLSQRGAKHVTGERQRTPQVTRPALLASKLRPTIGRLTRAPARLEEALRPRSGCLTLLHAGAGYGKTSVLAATHRPEWTWYNLDATDRDPAAFAARLGAALGVDARLPTDAAGDVLALELAQRLPGRATVTLDRGEQLGEAVELGRFLSELLVAAPALSVRLATRTRPALPLERLRLEGRLVELGPNDLRLNRSEVAQVLTAAWGHPPEAAQLDFADTVLDGWPAALQLWQAAVGEDGDLMAPLQSGQPLHEYLHEEVCGTLPDDVMDQLSRDWRWLVGRGPLLKRASNGSRRLVADRIVRDRVAVVPSRHGWRVHPLMTAFASMHASNAGAARLPQVATDREPSRGRPADAASGLAVHTFGGLRVRVDGVVLEDGEWPAASRRLLELLLCLPGGRSTANDAAETLWPNHPSRAARNSFNVALHGLRRVLEPDLTEGSHSRYVVREGRMYRLCLERLTCDAEEFAGLVRQAGPTLDESGACRLQAAVDLHADDFLASCEEAFAGERRAQLRTMLLTTLERLGQWYASAGRRELATSTLERLVSMEPGRRDAWERLMHLRSNGGNGHLASAG